MPSRTRVSSLIAATLVLGVSAGSVPASAAPGSPAATAAPLVAPAVSTMTAGSKDDLTRAIIKALGSSRYDVSVSVRDRRTGSTYAYNSSLVNCTGSIVKVLVLAARIRKARAAGVGLTAYQKSLAAKMIKYSDNDATTLLFRAAGGAPAITRTAKALGMTGTTGHTSWGRTATTSRDQRVLLDKLVGGTTALSKTDRDYILSLMAGVVSWQRWGVGKVPSGVRVELKNGWVPLTPRAWRVNTIGHVKGNGRDYTIAILSYDNSTMDAGVGRVNRVASLVYSSLAKPWG